MTTFSPTACAVRPKQRFAAASADQPSELCPRVLFGGLTDAGIALRGHEFTTRGPLDWARHLDAEAVVLCLNLAGEGTVRGTRLMRFEARTAGFFSTGAGGLRASRKGGQHHHFFTIDFSARWLRACLSACDGALHPLIEDFLSGTKAAADVAEVRPLPMSLEDLARKLVHPPVPQGARGVWYQGQVLQLMSEFFFERAGSDELFCDRQKRLAQERVQRVIAILRRDLAAPPGLETIGREVGCSPFYLSRTFSQEAGMTIPQYLRKLRMERAAELLREGRHNVTEAALEVGYSSLSHFSQAFCQIVGCCPGLYPLKAQPTANK